MRGNFLGNCMMVLIAAVVLFCLQACKDRSSENRYQIGAAQVSVTLVDGEEAWPDSVVVLAYYPTLFNLEQNNIDFIPLRFEGGKWCGEIPLEVLRSHGGGVVVLQPDDTYLTGVMCCFDQETPSDIKIKREKDGRFLWSATDKNDYISTPNQVASYFINFETAGIIASEEAYQTWQSYISEEIDSILPARLEVAFGDTDIDPELKKIVTEQLKQFYFKGRITWYVKDLKRFLELDVSEPPVEMYKEYLDRLDFSTDVVIDETMPELIVFYQQLLTHLPIGIPQIGESAVAEWQSAALPGLRKVISNPTQVLLDKLSAVAYITQIEEQNRPLSQQQIDNINAYYKDDLGKIILNRNQKIIDKLAATQAELIDLSEQPEFNLLDFMKRFDGRPVVVDLWNTWCGPCINAMKEFEEKKQSYADSDVVFLYICNTSSPEQKWHSYAERESGVHVRLSDDASYALMSEYDFDAIPSYLFFDRKHNLVEKYTGFPGVDGFVGSISKIEN